MNLSFLHSSERGNVSLCYLARAMTLTMTQQSALQRTQAKHNFEAMKLDLLHELWKHAALLSGLTRLEGPSCVQAGPGP
jgi:hypothetical protein